MDETQTLERPSELDLTTAVFVTRDVTSLDVRSMLVKVKGGQLYLEVKNRLLWLAAWAEEKKQIYKIRTDLRHLDLDLQLAVFHATVILADGTEADGWGSETEKDFPAGWIEKAETKAIGRALALAGFGTQFALELDEGHRVVDSPVTPRSGRDNLKVVKDQAAGTDQRIASLRKEVLSGLQADSDARAKLPKTAEEMSVDELEKTLSWLRNRAKRQL